MTPRVQAAQQAKGSQAQVAAEPRAGDAAVLGPAEKARWSGDLLRLEIDFAISYVAPGKSKGCAAREILTDVTGRLRPGRLMAILGPSGAGKTSCLSILAGCRTKGVRGRVLVNGREESPSAYRRHCVLIGQELAQLQALTAGETLRIAADLKLPASKYSPADRQAVVADIAGVLGLEACMETTVANMSGGERKRLSIGVELVTNPPIMLFDEPTSGLDSVSSVQVVSHLRSLALAGRTVAVVLHQPSSRMFQLFDDLLVLGPGRSLYCGPAAQAAEAFGASGFSCPPFYNIADFVVEVASGEHGQDFSALLGALPRPPRLPSSSDEDGGVATEAEPMLRKDDVVLHVGSPPPVPLFTGDVSYHVSFWVQFTVLLKRSLIISWRDMNMAWLRFAAHLLVALILGFLYKDIGDEASKINGNLACLFFFELFLFFSNAMPTVLTFPVEAAVFFREYSNNWYSLTAYYLSKVIADIPFMVINPTVFLLVAYYMTDQPNVEDRRCMVWLVCLLTVFLAHAYGLVFGAALGMQLGIFLVPASTIPLVLFSGFFLYIPDIPLVLRWLSYVSNFRYGFEGIVIAIYGMDRQPLRCKQAYCHWKRPTKFLEEIGMSNADYWTDITGLLTWIVVLHFSLLVSLKVKVILNRR
ncbi:ATP-binding cassette sub-family G member 4 [Frankliniella fusca]|uniref:ATP-binding cassette sub-family G member 4 n=1 Tax=Frankliniella fusca TaxID=407009 RepID=A0AAE1HUL6_9NEOP|nr:ATP-binding cassette sub-family G member 4 [Frankliniella fusca]